MTGTATCQTRAAARRVTTGLVAAAIMLAMAGVAHAVSTPAVRVNVTVPAMLETTFTDDGVLVRANAAWQLTAEVPGADPVFVTGGSTNGYEVVLPEGATAVAVCLR